MTTVPVRRTILVSIVLVLGIIMLVPLVPKAFAWKLVSHGTCRDWDRSNYDCIDPTSHFTTLDKEVWMHAEFDFRDIPKSVPFNAISEWRTPTGKVYQREAYEWSKYGGYLVLRTNRNLEISGIGNSQLGNWSVTFILDGGSFGQNMVVFTDHFTISKGGLLLLLPSSQTPVVVDGKVTGDEWVDSQAFSLKPAPFFSESNEATGEARISFKRDAQNLYVLCDFMSVTKIDAPPKRNDACYVLWQTPSMEENDAVWFTVVWAVNASRIALSTGHRFPKPPPLFDEIKSSFSISPTPSNSTPHLLIEASIPLLTLSYGLTQFPDMQIFPRLLRGVLPKGYTQFILGSDSSGALLSVKLKLLTNSLQFRFDARSSALVHVDTLIMVEPPAWDSWTSYNLTYTGGMRNVTSSDNIGALESSVTRMADQVQVHVLFRNPVHDGYKFTISFDLPNKVHSDGARNLLDFSWIELTTQSVEVKLPEDASDVILKTSPTLVGVISRSTATVLNLGLENPVTFRNSLPLSISPDQYIFSWSVSWVQKEVPTQASTMTATTSVSTATAGFTSRQVLTVAISAALLATIVFLFLRKRGWHRKVQS